MERLARRGAARVEPEPAPVSDRQARPGPRAIRRLGGGRDPGDVSPERATVSVPLPVTSLIGREQELRDVDRLLGAHRVVTLLGTGGVGKTRLALTAGTQLRERYPDGVWFVELATVPDAGLVAQAVASAVGLHEDAVPAAPRAPGRRARPPAGAPDPRQLRARGRSVRGARRGAAPRVSPARGAGDQPRAPQHPGREHVPGAVARRAGRARARAGSPGDGSRPSGSSSSASDWWRRPSP